MFSPRRSAHGCKEHVRSALQRTMAIQEVVEPSTLDDLSDIFNEYDSFDSENDIEEESVEDICLDSDLMGLSARILNRHTVLLTSKTNIYNFEHMARNVMSYVTSYVDDGTHGPPDWSILEKRALVCFKCPPRFAGLPLRLQNVPARKIAQRAAKDKETIVPKKPQTVATVAQENSVEKTLQVIGKIIVHHYKEKQQPLDFFWLILHPTDFGKTVENMLHVSFLVRDGLISITEHNGRIVVKPSSKEMIQEANRSGTKRLQNLLSLDKKQWRALNKIYRLETPIINI